ncbi:acylphosphatase [Candidatus Woesearchaeota archaeon CG10_big_fil_rev_8_21_14_0_10_44_13]|nr:MAG: acylphosphatase [Candidatus Woesearchaeota archaeon CG10_big_fil_rev_8_21_14_0_10_44_13]
MEKRYKIIVSGRVQGVFFRYTTKKTARNLGLKGYAKNLDDGTVEVVAQGNKDDLDRLVDFCRKGPLLARVDDVNVKEEKAGDEFEGFEVKY